MRLILFGGYFFGKMWTNMEKRPFFRVAMAGFRKYHTGGYGRIEVYRVKQFPNWQPYSCPILLNFDQIEFCKKYVVD